MLGVGAWVAERGATSGARGTATVGAGWGCWVAWGGT